MKAVSIISNPQEGWLSDDALGMNIEEYEVFEYWLSDLVIEEEIDRSKRSTQ